MELFKASAVVSTADASFFLGGAEACRFPDGGEAVGACDWRLEVGGSQTACDMRDGTCRSCAAVGAWSVQAKNGVVSEMQRAANNWLPKVGDGADGG